MHYKPKVDGITEYNFDFNEMSVSSILNKDSIFGGGSKLEAEVHRGTAT